MKPQTEESLTEAIKFLTDTMKDGKAFAVEQMPELCRQIYAYQLYSSIAGLILGCILLCISGFLVWKGSKREYDSEDFYRLAGILSLVWIIVFLFSGTNLMKCLTAPKLIILKELSRLL